MSVEPLAADREVILCPSMNAQAAVAELDFRGYPMSADIPKMPIHLHFSSGGALELAADRVTLCSE
jgi:hypothetical protein